MNFLPKEKVIFFKEEIKRDSRISLRTSRVVIPEDVSVSFFKETPGSMDYRKEYFEERNQKDFFEKKKKLDRKFEKNDLAGINFGAGNYFFDDKERYRTTKNDIDENDK